MCKIPSSFIFIFYSILFKNVFYMMKMYKFEGSEKGLIIGLTIDIFLDAVWVIY